MKSLIPTVECIPRLMMMGQPLIRHDLSQGWRGRTLRQPDQPGGRGQGLLAHLRHGLRLQPDQPRPAIQHRPARHHQVGMNSNALDRHRQWGFFYRHGGLFIDKGDYLSSSGIINRQEVLIIVNGGFFLSSRGIAHCQGGLFIVKRDYLSSRGIAYRQGGLLIAKRD